MKLKDGGWVAEKFKNVRSKMYEAQGFKKRFALISLFCTGMALN